MTPELLALAPQLKNIAQEIFESMLPEGHKIEEMEITKISIRPKEEE